MSKLDLRPARRADAGDLIAANRDSRAHHRPFVEPFTDEAGFDAWFDGLVTGANVGLVARDAESGRIVGVVNLSQIFLKGFRSAYLGYYGMRGFSGRGLMTEAVRLATRFAFDAVGLHRVEANIQPDNHRSIALVKRLGFRLEGFSPRYLMVGGAWRDHERWALLSDEVTAATEARSVPSAATDRLD
ncbi:GNAT family N-acetyltransferase [Jiella sp. M17.18]|uniref:GNAT family N-acetyltransferase n=1 Tax=Jiella sp. M17.18 TaxID=3234247 RepID=UPI0034E01AF9